MDVRIHPSGTVDLELMRDLSELSADIAESDIATEDTHAVLPGVKDGGLTVGIAAAGLAFSAVTSIVSVLTYWLSKKPKYTVTIEAAGRTCEVTELTRKSAMEFLRELKDASELGSVHVKVQKP